MSSCCPSLSFFLELILHEGSACTHSVCSVTFCEPQGISHTHKIIHRFFSFFNLI